MLFRLFHRDPRADTISALYGAIVAQARNESFYRGFGVPDTVEGRFDMIVLHLALFCRRLARETGPVHGFAQGVFDLFCRDMDHNLREMGVGDLSVPKKMRGFAEAFYGRAEAYDRGFADVGDELAAALGRNVLGEACPSACARRLADYARAAAQQLDSSDAAMLGRGELVFPDPDTISAEAERPSR